MSSRPTDERGQILSSFAAVAAVVAIAAGALVLLGTRGGPGGDAAALPQTTAGATAKPSASSPTARPSAPATTAAPTEVTPSQPSDSPTTAPTAIPAAQLPAVEVFNNTKRKGLAEQVANKARAVGWQVAGADNWHGKVVASTVYYPAGMQAAARQLAEVLGIDRIKDALPNMKMDRLSVILTGDYDG